MLIDAHAHLNPHPTAVDRLVRSMDLGGIDKSIVVGGGLVSPNVLAKWMVHSPPIEEVQAVRCDNLGILQNCLRANGRLFPYFFANPWSDIDEYRQFGREFFGLKLAPAIHQLPFTHPKMRTLYEIAVSHRHAVYTHCLARNGFSVADLAQIASEFPTLTFILGHAGIGQIDFYAVDLVATNANIKFETSGGMSGVIAYACAQLGASRVIFGSEYPLQDQRVELLKISLLGLAECDFAQVTRYNTEQLLGFS